MAILAEGIEVVERRHGGDSVRRREIVAGIIIAAMLTFAVGVAAFTLPTTPTQISLERGKAAMPLGGPRAPM